MVDDDAGRTPNHGHSISSPCEPNRSGELMIHTSVLGKQGPRASMSKLSDLIAFT